VSLGLCLETFSLGLGLYFEWVGLGLGLEALSVESKSAYSRVQWRWLTCLPCQQVLSLEGGDVGHRCEDVCTVHYRSLNAVALIDAPVPSFFVQYELQQHQSHCHS